jgi:hypothetical protein
VYSLNHEFLHAHDLCEYDSKSCYSPFTFLDWSENQSQVLKSLKFNQSMGAITSQKYLVIYSIGLGTEITKKKR